MTNLIVSPKALEVVQEELDQQTKMFEWDRSKWPADEVRHYKTLNANRMRILQTIRDLINKHGGDAYSMILDLMQDLTIWDSNRIRTLLRHFAPKASTFKWRYLDSHICFMSFPPEPADYQPSYKRNERAKPYEYITVWNGINTVIDQLYQTMFDSNRETSQLIIVNWSDLCTPYTADYTPPNSMKIVTTQNESNKIEWYVVPRNLNLLCSRVCTRTRLVILHTQIDIESLKRVLRASIDNADAGFCRPTPAPDGSAYIPEYFADFLQTPQEPSVVRAIEQHIEKYSAKCVRYVGSELNSNITTAVYDMLYRLRNNMAPDALEDFAIYEV